MFKAMNNFGVCLLTCVFQVVRKTGVILKPWQASIFILIHKKGDKKKCTKYRSISLLSIPGKINEKCLEKRCCEIFKTQLQNAQCGFCPGRSIMDQIFALQRVLKLWKYAKEVYEVCSKSIRLFCIKHTTQ